MGKVQSKHGECFVVNAHFNPVCQVDEDSIYNKSIRDSFACSELSFSLCEDNSCIKTPSSPNERFPLQVLPPEDDTSNMKKLEEKEETPEKAEEEKNEKEDTTEATCSVTIDDKEKQEFSFTLYDFDGHSKFSKEDVEKVVMRSICDALGKTLKLPPSGSRTIKVRLAVTPDSSTDSCTKEEETSECENKVELDNTLNSDYSTNTNSTYLCTSNEDKLPETNKRYHNPQLGRIPSPVVKGTASPSIRSRKAHRLSCQKAENSEWTQDIGEKICADNENKRRHHEGYEAIIEEHRHRHRHKHQHRERGTGCRDRRNNYLDLAGIDNCNKSHEIYSSNCNDGAFICPYRLLDRNHMCSKLHRGKDMMEQTRTRIINDDMLYGNRFMDPKNDLLNLSFDMCSWERHHHRRSKSYDIYENPHHPNIPNSPKVKQRPGRSASLNPTGVSPMNNHTQSPNHHHQRHREREREHQRAMQRVASWIEREHLGSGNQKEQMRRYACLGHPRRSSQLVVERHEHHHLHEHVHHHYHHYVDS